MILLNILINNSISVADENNTIYVDDDNTNGPWEGTIDHPFQSVQDAIDFANEGDTIFVHNGEYLENIRINKSSIDLQGESKHTTIIDGIGSSRVIYIIGSWISISNFTITNCSDSGIGIQMGGFPFLYTHHIK